MVCCRAKQPRNKYGETRRKATTAGDRPHWYYWPTSTHFNTWQEVHRELLVWLYTLCCYVCVAPTYRHCPKIWRYDRASITKFGVNIAQLCCENAWEIIRGWMCIYCDNHGIVQPAEPYKHQQSCRIERFNCTLMERTRALLYEAELPPKYWSFVAYAPTHP